MIKLEFIDYGKNYFFIDEKSIIKFIKNLINFQIIDFEIGFKSTDLKGKEYLYKIYESIFDLDNLKIEQLNQFLLNKEYLRDSNSKINWFFDNKIWYIHLNIMENNNNLSNEIDNIYNQNISDNEKKLLKNINDFWILNLDFKLERLNDRILNTSAYFFNDNKSIKLLYNNDIIDNRINKRFIFKNQDSLIKFIDLLYNYFDRQIYALTANLNINLTYINDKNELVFQEVFKQNEDSYEKLDDFKEMILSFKKYKLYNNNYDWYSKIHFWYIDFSSFGESEKNKNLPKIFYLSKKDYQQIINTYFNCINNEEKIFLKNINFSYFYSIKISINNPSLYCDKNLIKFNNLL